MAVRTIVKTIANRQRIVTLGKECVQPNSVANSAATDTRISGHGWTRSADWIILAEEVGVGRVPCSPIVRNGLSFDLLGVRLAKSQRFPNAGQDCRIANELVEQFFERHLAPSRGSLNKV